MSIRLLIATLSVALVLAKSTSVLAEPDKAAMKSASLQLVQEAEAKYRARQFEAAAELIERAHALDPDPRLFFDWARALEGAGEIEEAVEKYASYVAAAPSGGHRAEAQERMEQLAARIEGRSGDGAPVPGDSTTAETSRRRRAQSSTPWIVIGAGGAALVAGGVLGALAVARRQKALDEPINETAVGYAAEAKDIGAAANVAYAAGGAIAIGGFIWLIVDRSSSERAPSVIAAIGPDGVMIAGSF